jgi:creatinine amidohydrolase/Fe(II)-dependent formamide hydrolase-like protein
MDPYRWRAGAIGHVRRRLRRLRRIAVRGALAFAMGRSMLAAAATAMSAGALVASATLGTAAATPAPPAPAPLPASPTVFLEELTWTELRDAVAAGATTALVPIGGTEQSGPALVLGKHNVRARVLAGMIARRLGNALVAPVIAYVPEGSIEPPSGHMRFAGTISVPVDVFERTLEAAARSLKAAGFRTIVLLGDHGGYQDSVQRVAHRLMRAWGPGVGVLAPPDYYRASSVGFAALLRARGYRDDEIGTHAGLADTALQMALDPAGVRVGELQAAHGAASGVTGGDPRRASAELGALGVEAIVDATVAAIRAADRATDRNATRSAGK